MRCAKSRGSKATSSRRAARCLPPSARRDAAPCHRQRRRGARAHAGRSVAARRRGNRPAGRERAAGRRVASRPNRALPACRPRSSAPAAERASLEASSGRGACRARDAGAGAADARARPGRAVARLAVARGARSGARRVSPRRLACCSPQANGRVEQRGAVADYLEVDRRYERAVEALLGDLLQHVVVPTHEHAAAGVQLLREHGGRPMRLRGARRGAVERGRAARRSTARCALDAVVQVDGPGRGERLRAVAARGYVADSWDAAIAAAQRPAWTWRRSTARSCAGRMSWSAAAARMRAAFWPPRARFAKCAPAWTRAARAVAALPAASGRRVRSRDRRRTAAIETRSAGCTSTRRRWSASTRSWPGARGSRAPRSQRARC